MLTFSDYDFGRYIYGLVQGTSTPVVVIAGLTGNAAFAVKSGEVWNIIESDLDLITIGDMVGKQVVYLDGVYHLCHIQLGTQGASVLYTSSDLETWSLGVIDMTPAVEGHSFFNTNVIVKDGVLHFFYADVYTVIVDEPENYSDVYCDFRVITSTDGVNFSDQLVYAGEPESGGNIVNGVYLAMGVIYIDFFINVVQHLGTYIDGVFTDLGEPAAPFYGVYSVGDDFLRLYGTTIESSPDMVVWSDTGGEGSGLLVINGTLYGITPTGTLLIGTGEAIGEELYYNSTITGLIQIELSTDLAGDGLFVSTGAEAFRVVKRGDQLGTIKIGSDSLSEIL